MSAKQVRPQKVRAHRHPDQPVPGDGEWYRKVLHAWPAFENDFLAFITYDDEHHRLAFVNTPGAADPAPAGVDHFAYTYATLDDLVTPTSA